MRKQQGREEGKKAKSRTCYNKATKQDTINMLDEYLLTYRVDATTSG